MMSTYRIPRIAMICAMLIGSVVAKSQADLLAHETIDEIVLEVSEESAQVESESEKTVDAIIVDVTANEKAYPSLEEEMDMYIQLRTELPLAYFFPNPSNGIIWIEHNLGTDASVLIKDDSGELIYEAQKMRAKKLDLSKLETGSYSIELVKGDNRVIRGLKVI